MKFRYDVPIWVPVGSGLLLGAWLFFMQPVFLNAQHTMLIGKYIPTNDVIGEDLRLMLTYTNAWLAGGTPYIGSNLYPPLANVLFTPLAGMELSQAFLIISLITVCAYLSVALLLPPLINRRLDRATWLLLALTGFVSYGLQFELSKGQFNVLTFTLAVWAIFIFHKSDKLAPRFLAYALFTVAIQLKLYPAIFFLLLTTDAWQWRANLTRWVLLGAANIALLFTLGQAVFLDFFNGLRTQIASSYNVWVGDHSISSWTAYVQHTAPGPSPLRSAADAILIICFAITLAVAYRRNDRRFAKYLFLLCGLCTLLIPAVSHDYKLPLLTLYFIIFICESESTRLYGINEYARVVLLFALSTLYASTLYSFIYKPALIKNNAPALLAICVVTTLVMISELATYKSTRIERFEPEPVMAG